MINWISNKKINYEKVNSLLQKSLECNQFTNYGPNVRLLEDKIREILLIDEEKSIIVVNNGSTALQVLTSSIDYFNKKKHKWATQSFTFPPSAQGNLSNVRIIDIDLEGGIDLNQINDDIDGIIVTNIFGNIVNINKYEKWAKDNNKFLIFDNAATPYTFYKGKNSCNYGNGSTISFHHTKPLGFGEGGAIIVDKKYEKNIRCLINFGIDLTENYWVKEGNNYKMSDISAVYILQYLDNFDEILNKNLQMYNYMKERLPKNIKLFPTFDDGTILPSCFCLLFDNYNDNIRIKMIENNIFCRKYYHPLKDTKNTIEIYKKILCLPCNVDMNLSDIDIILSLLS